MQHILPHIQLLELHKPMKNNKIAKKLYLNYYLPFILQMSQKIDQQEIVLS